MNLNKIKRKLNERMTGYALQPTDDEVNIMWLVCEVDRLNELLKIGQSKGDSAKIIRDYEGQCY